MISFQVSEQQLELVSLVRDLLKREVLPLVQEMDQRDQQSFDWRLAESLARINMVAPNIAIPPSWYLKTP